MTQLCERQPFIAEHCSYPTNLTNIPLSATDASPSLTDSERHTMLLFLTPAPCVLCVFPPPVCVRHNLPAARQPRVPGLPEEAPCPGPAGLRCDSGALAGTSSDLLLQSQQRPEPQGLWAGKRF